MINIITSGLFVYNVYLLLKTKSTKTLKIDESTVYWIGEKKNKYSIQTNIYFCLTA